MSYLQVFKVRPGEVRTLEIDFSDRLPAGVLLDSGTVTAVNVYSNASAAILGSSSATIAVDGLSAAVVVQNVTANMRYQVTFTLTCDDVTPTILKETILVIGSELGL